jgi:hypothetical protein
MLLERFKGAGDEKTVRNHIPENQRSDILRIVFKGTRRMT